MPSADYRTAAIVGLGYVGLPLALLFARRGFSVTGIDIDPHKVAMLMEDKRSYLSELSDAVIEEAIGSGRFQATTDFGQIRLADAVIICVPTPLTPDHLPDLTLLTQAVANIEPYLRLGHLVVLESSTYPGTTEEVMVPLLAAKGLRVGKEVFIGYSPERVDPGRDVTLESIPKVVSGVTPACLARIEQVYGQVFAKLVPVSNPRTAEMVKLVENTQRLVNISLVNELRDVCRRFQVDIWEVVDAAATKPYGFMPYYPGPGIGGHCIPVDPLYLKWKSNRLGMSTTMIDAADEINRMTPSRIVSLLSSFLGSGALASLRILVLGVTYKKDVNDVRESPALEIIGELRKGGATVGFCDPLVGELQVDGTVMTALPLTEDTLRAQDCVLILVDHSSVDYAFVVSHAPLVIDTRNATKDVSERDRVIVL